MLRTVLVVRVALVLERVGVIVPEATLVLVLVVVFPLRVPIVEAVLLSLTRVALVLAIVALLLSARALMFRSALFLGVCA